MDLKVIGTIAAILALGVGCTSSTSDDDDTGGAGGEGGSAGGEGGEGGSTGGEGGEGGAVGGEGGGGAGGAGGDCIFCAEAFEDAESDFCDDQAEQLWFAFEACICTDSCDADCGDNLCSGLEQSDECTACITASCDTEFNECANDVN